MKNILSYTPSFEFVSEPNKRYSDRRDGLPGFMLKRKDDKYDE